MNSKQKRSGFEERCGAILEPAGFTYESDNVRYPVWHKYTPDFIYPSDTYHATWVECKGWFRPGDRLKYQTIARHLLHPDHFIELVFLLQAPNKKVQKGAKLTMSGWCDKHDIRWFGTAEELVEWACDE
jgi:hypothetical protein